MNIHAPTRRPEENQAEYHQRLSDSKRTAQRMTLTGPYAAKGGTSSRQQLRDLQKKNGTFRAGTYGQGLRNQFDRKIAAASAERMQRRVGK